MNLTLTIFEVVSPVFLLGAIGFTWVKLGFEYRIEFVTKLAMTLSVPCLIFISLMQTELDRSALAALSLASVTAYAAVSVAVIVLVWALGLDRRTYAAPLIFSNTGNLGLPLALFAFGEIGLSYAIIVFAIMAIWSFTFGIWLVAGAGSFGKVLKEPLVGATLLGALFLWMGWETPKFLTNALDLVGQMAIPMMLITLGVAVARLSPQGMGKAIAPILTPGAKQAPGRVSRPPALRNQAPTPARAPGKANLPNGPGSCVPEPGPTISIPARLRLRGQRQG